MKRTLRALVNTSWLLAACASTSAGQVGQSSSPGSTQPPPFTAAPAPGTGGSANVTSADAGVATLGANAPDRGGDADFAAARAKFDKGDREGAQAALEAFLAQHPTNANRPAADLMLGRLALAHGDAVAAKRLTPFAPMGAPPPSCGDDTAVELRGALAEATGPADPTEGLELWEAYYH